MSGLNLFNSMRKASYRKWLRKRPYGKKNFETYYRLTDMSFWYIGYDGGLSSEINCFSYRVVKVSKSKFLLLPCGLLCSHLRLITEAPRVVFKVHFIFPKIAIFSVFDIKYVLKSSKLKLGSFFEVFYEHVISLVVISYMNFCLFNDWW